MSSGMNLEQAKEYAKTMTYREAVSNVKYSKGIKYRKATMIKLRELAEIADRLDHKTEPQTNKDFEVTYTCSFTDCDNFKNFGFGEKCIECKRKQSEAKYKDEPQTERTCTNCKHNGVLSVPKCDECHDMDKHEFIEPQTEEPKIRKRIDKPFRAVWLDDDHNEIGTPQTERSE